MTPRKPLERGGDRGLSQRFLGYWLDETSGLVSGDDLGMHGWVTQLTDGCFAPLGKLELYTNAVSKHLRRGRDET